MIIALDPAKRCGWADSSGHSGAWDLDPACREYSFYRLIAKAYEDCRSRSGQLVGQHGVTGILASEDAAAGANNMNTRYRHSELCGVMKLFAQEHRMTFVLVNPKTLKAWSTGNGNATKEHMMAALKMHYGMVIDDPDQADAISVLKYVQAGQHLKVDERKQQEKEARRKNARRGPWKH